MNPLGRQILKDVSRSFYLSMRLLPRPMREPVSLAYLLARASDTLADTPTSDPKLRLRLLERFLPALKNEQRAPWLDELNTAFVPLQKHEGEKALLVNMDGVFRWYDSLTQEGVDGGDDPYYSTGFGADQKRSIMTVLEHIIRGQRLDIERFELSEGFRFSLDAELEEYCYLVAGCVGEFWTEIGEMTLGDFSNVDSARLKRWGANYGKGLQLINILRDAPEDLANGRCYFPEVNSSNRSTLMVELNRWRQRAREYLQDGMSYAESIQHRRARTATVLPCLIGERTLDLLDEANWEDLEQGIKIPRRSVYHCAMQAFFF